MHDIRFENERTADMALLGAFPETADLTLDFFVLPLEDLSALAPFSLTFDVEPDFFAFLDLGSLSELSWSLASTFFLLRLLEFPPASGSGRAVRFFGGDGGESICSSFPFARS